MKINVEEQEDNLVLLLDRVVKKLDDVIDEKVDNPWDDLIESLDLNAKLIEILGELKTMDSGENNNWYGVDFSAGMEKAYYLTRSVIDSGVSKLPKTIEGE